MIHARRFADPREFLTAAEPLLASDRARSTIISTVSTGLVSLSDSEQPPTLVVALDGPAVLGLALRTPPHPLTVLIDPGCGDGGRRAGGAGRADRADRADRAAVARALARAVLVGGPLPEMVTGPRVDVAAVGAALLAAWPGGGASRQHTAMLLYRLGELVPPDSVRGGSRAVDHDDPVDVELVARWTYDFLVETRTVPQPAGPDPETIRRRAARGGVMVLWVEGGAPAAMAGHSAVVGGMARIGPVFTPEPLRGNGYGSAATAAAVRSAQSSGANTVVLFTDADYPTSNAVYRRLGFEPVEDFLELELRTGGQCPADRPNAPARA
jgi:GNAT superfamily N-acetyltransferase